MTSRSVRTAEGEIIYDARATETIVTDGEGRPGARFVCWQYVRTDALEVESDRPVLFVFNGGPGSASVWTHLGLGPRRVADADTLSPGMSPPFTLVDNADTLLAFADLVFIDPPGTGFSRVLDPERESAFYGVEQDARAMLEFIAVWTRTNRREASPRFLVGESYGTMRAARMARMAMGGPFTGGRTRSTSLTGVIVLGPALGFGLSSWGSRVMDALALPSLVATANFHRGLAGDPEAAWEFARSQLVPAVLAGDALEDGDRDRIASSVAELTGLSVDDVMRHGMTISPAEFARLIRRGEGEHVGLYDSRYALPSSGLSLDPVADDPGMGQYAPMFLGAIEAYLRDELGHDTDDEYIAIDFANLNSRWDYGAGAGISPLGPLQTPVDAVEDFAVALRRDLRFEVHVAVGEYDLVTTWSEARFALSQSSHDTTRMRLVRYPSGHMPYLGKESRAQLRADLQSFVTRLSR